MQKNEKDDWGRAICPECKKVIADADPSTWVESVAYHLACRPKPARQDRV